MLIKSRIYNTISLIKCKAIVTLGPGGRGRPPLQIFNIIITPEFDHISNFVLLGTSGAPSPTVIILFVYIGFVELYNIVHQG